jgi:hypothetical protein
MLSFQHLDRSPNDLVAQRFGQTLAGSSSQFTPDDLILGAQHSISVSVVSAVFCQQSLTAKDLFMGQITHMRESFAMQKTIRIYAKVHPNYEPRKHP